MKSPDITGQKFELLTAVKRVENASFRQARWLFKCDCGNEVAYRIHYVKKGAATSCGCKRHEPRPNRRLESGEAAFNGLLYSYKQTAVDRGHTFMLSKEEFKSLTKQNCHYCGIEPKQVSTDPSWFGDYVYNGIDRLDSNIGYNLSNVVACCKTCNYAKRQMTIDEFKEWILKVYNNLGLKCNSTT